MEDRITINLREGVADVRLMRADKMNALDDAMFGALVVTGEKLKTQKRRTRGRPFPRPVIFFQK